MIPQLPFGRTGHASARVIFGASALSQAAQPEADRVLDLLLEYGVNHVETAPVYGNAEKCIGPWMEKHRGDFFVATGTAGVSGVLPAGALSAAARGMAVTFQGETDRRGGRP
jgi:aryl-alcohol dehydrogenase-like predicted oxidoreductase